MLTASKWARDDNESDDEQKTSTKDLGLTYSFSGSENAGDEIPKCVEMDLASDASVPVRPDSGINEEQRQKLRRVEVALIEYRESFQDQGVKDVREIEKKVAVHQKRLESELGVVHSNENNSINKRRTSDRRERRDESRESSRKRNRSHSESKSPQRKSSSRDRERENEGNGDTERHSDRANELESERRNREKSASRDREDGRDRGRERDRDRRRKMK